MIKKLCVQCAKKNITKLGRQRFHFDDFACIGENARIMARLMASSETINGCILTEEGALPAWCPYIVEQTVSQNAD